MIGFKRTILTILVFTLIITNFVYADQPQDMTRVGFVKEILKVMDAEIEQVASSPFSDIEREEDILFLSTAFNKKIITGHGGEFNPEEFVTNEQAVIMLVRALGVINIDQDEASKTQIKFLDSSKISDWAKPYIAYAIKYGLVDESKEKFRPGENLTKLESQQILKKFKESFVREGLTAMQVLKLADINLQKYNTYKFKGSADVTTKVKLPNGKEQVSTYTMNQEEMLEGIDGVEIYARYGEDVEINGEEYYVIKVDVDTEDFLEMYKETIDETYKYIFEGETWEQMKKDQGVPGTMDEEILKDTVKSATKQVLENMNIQIMQEYYIHKEDKNYSKLMLKQLINTQLLGVETRVTIDGNYEYYGFEE